MKFVIITLAVIFLCSCASMEQWSACNDAISACKQLDKEEQPICLKLVYKHICKFKEGE